MKSYAIVCLLLTVQGCVARTPTPGADVDEGFGVHDEARPDETSAGGVERPGATPSGCVARAGVGPEPPSESEGFVLAEVLDASGAVVETRRRTVSVARGPLDERVETVETLDAVGQVRAREVHRSVDERVVFESRERLDLPPDGMLPYTYGQSATQSTTYRWEAGDRLVEKSVDDAMDGSVDERSTWVFDAAGVVRRHTLESRGHRRTTHYDASGRSLSSVDDAGSGQVWIRDDAGRVLREETRGAGGILVAYQENTWLSGDRQESLRAFVMGVAASGAVAPRRKAERKWRYDDAGTLRSIETWSAPEGTDRRGLEVFDERGRLVLSSEESRDGACRVFERRYTYAGDTEILTRQETTCDGVTWTLIEVELDEAGRMVRETNRSFIPSSPSSTRERRIAYGACGAVVLEESFNDRVLTSGTSTTVDARGRVIRRVTRGRGRAPATVDAAWDEHDRLLAWGDQRWTYDEHGRLLSHTYGPDVARSHRDSPASAVATRYTFAEDERSDSRD